MNKREWEVLLEQLGNFGFSFSHEDYELFLSLPETHVRDALHRKTYRRMGRERAKAEIMESYKKQMEADKKYWLENFNRSIKEGERGMEELLSQWDELVEQEEKDEREFRKELEEIKRMGRNRCPTCGKPRK